MRAGSTNYSMASVKEIAGMLALDQPGDIEALYAEARNVRRQTSGDIVYLRGLFEVSNQCRKDCFYCGIRASNTDVERYQLRYGDILSSCKWAMQKGFGSIVLQAGERQDKAYKGWIERLVAGIREISGDVLKITLSLGEQDSETYKRWYDAGAERYLLRIETSSRELYKSMHPADHDFDVRLNCLRELKEIGYQVGTGVMIGLPGQELEDLARDLLFFRDMDADMIGMGPYLYHSKTPMGAKFGVPDSSRQLELGLKMLACARILLRDVNLAATTALEAIRVNGRELGISAGANVVMPNLTETLYRGNYCLYQDKPGTDKDAVQSLEFLKEEIKRSGCEIGWNRAGDAPHFKARTCLAEATA